MKKVRGGLVALGLALAMIVSLAACDDGSFDASAHVKNQLDEWYVGKVESEWMENVGVTAKEVEEVYLDAVQVEVDAFTNYARIDYPEDVNDRLLELWKQICAKASYEVQESGKPDSDGNYSVKVLIKPLDIYKLVDEAFPAFSETFEAQFADVDTEAMTAEEYGDWFENEYDKAYRDGICDMLESLVPQVGYLDEKSIVVQVVKDSNGYYGLADSDIPNLSDAIISAYY